ncbi:MAG: ribosome recycling factor [Bacteroidales bacterium]|nr:ribosome recycling factor [Bacteroidales bacterium]MDD6772458.1 ribosome recycling factor [Bacteroidales bacterium]MDO4213251.1 ribosome recycling factor [Bacteroidales bacterium]
MLTDRAKEIISQTESKMKDAVKFLEEDLKTYKVGKANPAVFNGVLVDYYGTPSPIANVASISAPDAKTLAIQPWEKSMISKIEKAIIDANLGFTPQNNGETIRCVVPALTEERRKDLIKKLKASAENSKIVVRNARRDGVDLLKKAQKNEGLSEDIEKDAEAEVQKVTDKNIKVIDELVAAKEKEIMTV